jgi:hypothetical protein
VFKEVAEEIYILNKLKVESWKLKVMGLRL